MQRWIRLGPSNQRAHGGGKWTNGQLEYRPELHEDSVLVWFTHCCFLSFSKQPGTKHCCRSDGGSEKVGSGRIKEILRREEFLTTHLVRNWGEGQRKVSPWNGQLRGQWRHFLRGWAQKFEPRTDCWIRIGSLVSHTVKSRGSQRSWLVLVLLFLTLFPPPGCLLACHILRKKEFGSFWRLSENSMVCSLTQWELNQVCVQ